MLNSLEERNRTALKLLHEAAVAISDDERDWARRLQWRAVRVLMSPWLSPVQDLDALNAKEER